MKNTPTLFDIDDMVIARPWQRVAPVVVEATEDDVTSVAGIALFGELLDHLGLVDSANRSGLRPIGPGGYSGGGVLPARRGAAARRRRLHLRRVAVAGRGDPTSSWLPCTA